MCVACVFYKPGISAHAAEEQEAEHNEKCQHLEHEYIDFLSMAVGPKWEDVFCDSVKTYSPFKVIEAQNG